MLEIGIALAVTMLAWWLGTGLILYVDNLPRRTHRASMTVATGVLAMSILGLYATRDTTTAASAYLAFFCGLGVWAWQELSFLTGWVTGPRRAPCPVGCSPQRRFVCAVRTLLHHEIAILVAGLILFALLWNAPNQVGLWTYGLLWVMRISAKLNVYLGVPNLSDDLLPPHLGYLKSYFRRAPMNGLFPISVTLGTCGAAWLAHDAWLPGATPHEAIGGALLATLLALAVLEHWMMLLPVRDTLLWSWAKPTAAAPEARRAAAAGPAERDRNTFSQDAAPKLRAPVLCD